MSRRNYPRLHNINARPKLTKPCACCAEPARHVVWIEWSYMRGEDEDYYVCDKHRQMAQKAFPDFIAAINNQVVP